MLSSGMRSAFLLALALVALACATPSSDAGEGACPGSQDWCLIAEPECTVDRVHHCLRCVCEDRATGEEGPPQARPETPRDPPLPPKHW